jgi:ketosteroid isomerase-like protein
MTSDHPSGQQLSASELLTLRRMIDRQAISDCIHRYARGVDRNDADLLRSAYHADAVENHAGYVAGVDRLVPFLQQVHAGYSGYQRHLSNLTIDIDGDVAHAETYFLSVIRSDGSAQLMLTGGRYVDRLERRDGDWRIANRVVVIEYHGACEGGAPPQQAGVAPTLDRTDVSYQRPLVVTPRD